MKKTISKDPHLDREKTRYENPIPSREFILDTIANAKRKPNHVRLCKVFALEDPEQQDALLWRLKAMLRDQQLHRTRKGIYTTKTAKRTLTGTIQANPKGYGFVMVDDKQTPDIFIDNVQMRQVFDGDSVRVNILHEDSGKRLEGEITEVIERKTRDLVGTYRITPSGAFVVPDQPRLTHWIVCDQTKHNGHLLQDGDKVAIELTAYPTLTTKPHGKIVRYFGHESQADILVELALRTFDIPAVWPTEVEQQAQACGDSPSAHDKAQRLDLRDKPFVTIDGATAKDFDDAVYGEKKRAGGWRVWVAIADVSHYVRVGSALDAQASKRSTSVYFPQTVVPMLPSALSNGLCSLNPDQDRLVLVCEMTISAQGRISGYVFYEATIRSHARLTYDQAHAFLQSGAEQTQSWHASVRCLYDVYHVLQTQRESRGAIAFESSETAITFNADGSIKHIDRITRNDAHKLIEECMLAANVCAARFLSTYNMTGLYRTHEGPSDKKLSVLREFLKARGLPFSANKKPTVNDYHALSLAIVGRKDQSIIETMMLRSMSTALYECSNRGHFGLAYPNYTHFTSPIRRYPDLLVHRAIKSMIYDTKPCVNIRRFDGAKSSKPNQYRYSPTALRNLAAHASMAERRADDASRDVDASLKCLYLKPCVGQSFKAKAVYLGSFGMYVMLLDVLVEAVVPIHRLGDDYFQFDEAKQHYVGERTRQTIRLGDTIDVIVEQVDLASREIKCMLPSSKNSGQKHVKKRRKSRKK